MATFCLHPRSGDDANDGSDWAHAWKTIAGGATADRIAPGDTIKIAKSASSSLGTATWTNNSATVTLPAAKTKNISLCEATTGWTPSANVTLTADSGSAYRNQGSYSIKNTIAAEFTTGIICYLNLGASGIDYSAYDAICLYVYSNGAISAGVISLRTCSNQDGTGTIDDFDLGALVSGGNIIVLKKSSGNLGTVKSICLYANSDPGTVSELYLDNIFAFSQATPLHLGTPIGKNDGKWWAIRSINATTITLGNPFVATYASKYYGKSETVTTYSLDAYEQAAGDVIQESGTKGSLETYEGGYNTSTGSVDGITWIYGRVVIATGAIGATQNYIAIKNIGSSFFYATLYASADCYGNEFENLCFAAQRYGWFNPSVSNTFSNFRLSGTFIGVCPSTAYYACASPPKSQGWYGDVDIELYGNDNASQGELTFEGSLHRFTGTVKVYTLTGRGMGIGSSGAGVSNDIYVANVEIYGVTGTNAAIFINAGQGPFEIGKLVLNGCTSSRNLTINKGLLRIGNLIHQNGSSYAAYFAGSGVLNSKCFVDRLDADNRWKMEMSSGTVTDQITGGQNAAWANGGSGLCLYFNPNSQDYPLLWNCYAPVSSGVAQKLNFYVKKTSSGANPTMIIDITGCGVDLVQQSVTLTDSWALYESSSFTPTAEGFIRIDFRVFDGATTGDIGIDDISVVTV